jgi:Na+-transporting methylmalonyl-CoA/oxaloacetate decarboxylase gamma subunit
MNLVASVSLPPVVAYLSEYPTISESLGFQLTGLVVVFTALGSIWCLLELMALWFKRTGRAAKPAVAAAVAAPAPVSPDGLEPQVIAAMAAAVHATLGRTGRITSIVQVDAPDHGWGLEGRRQIHSARKVR